MVHDPVVVKVPTRLANVLEASGTVTSGTGKKG